jgi:hypothetical protein
VRDDHLPFRSTEDQNAAAFRETNATAAADQRHTVAKPGYNRWLIPPAALAVHLRIGQAYDDQGDPPAVRPLAAG